LTCKVIDTCSIISLTKAIRSCDILSELSGYTFVTTGNVEEELGYEVDPRIKIHYLSENELALHEKIYRIEGLGSGEVSAMVWAIFLNENTDSKVVFLSDDRDARAVFKEWIKEDHMRRLYPRIEEIIVADTLSLLKRQIDKKVLGEDRMKNIRDDLNKSKRFRPELIEWLT